MSRGRRGWAVAALAAVAGWWLVRGVVPGWVLLGAAGLAVVGALADRFRWSVTAALGGAAAVVVVAGTAMWPQRRAAEVTLVVVLAAVAAGLASLSDRVPTPVPSLLALATLGGVYACVPETDQIPPVARAAVVMTVATLLVGRSQARTLVLALCGVIGWAVLFGGAERDSALVGGLASFGVLAVAPAVLVLWPRPAFLRLGRRAPSWCWLLGLQVVFCLGVSRTAGLAASLFPALVGAAVWVTALVVGLVAVVGSATVLHYLAPDGEG